MLFLTYLRGAGVAIGLAAAGTTFAQGFNVDFDIEGGGAIVGQGVPDPTFGAAGNQPGIWNAYGVAASLPMFLLGLDGIMTSVTMSKDGIGGGLGGGSNLPINTGNYCLLLNDYAHIPNFVTYRFSGLHPGAYRVVVYAVNASGQNLTVPVSVQIPGAAGPNPQVVTGPMPGNSFQYLVTNSIHEIPSLSGDLLINLSGPWPHAYVNGFQVVAVPEPVSFCCTAIGISYFLSGRRRKRT